MRTILNLMFTMALCGLWHGATWMFVIWGLLHGALLSVERIYNSLLRALPDRAATITDRIRESTPYVVVSTVMTFAAVTAAWAFFRAQTPSDAIYFISAVPWAISLLASGQPTIWQQEWVYVLIVAFLHFLIFVRVRFFPHFRPHWAVYSASAAVMLFAVCTAWESTNVFIYFQF